MVRVLSILIAATLALPTPGLGGDAPKPRQDIKVTKDLTPLPSTATRSPASVPPTFPRPRPQNVKKIKRAPLKKKIKRKSLSRQAKHLRGKPTKRHVKAQARRAPPKRVVIVPPRPMVAPSPRPGIPGRQVARIPTGPPPPYQSSPKMPRASPTPIIPLNTNPGGKADPHVIFLDMTKHY